MKKVIFVMLSILIIGFIFTGMTAAQTPQYVWKVSHNGNVDPLLNPISYQVFKTEVERLSAGKVKVDIYPNSQLGDNASAVEQLTQGTIEVVNSAIGVLASMYFPKLSLLEMPFMFSSREVARKALDVNNPFIRQLIEECAEKTGIRILSFFPFGARQLTNNIRPIHTPDDMKGLKIRVQQIVPHIELMKSLGATPTPIPFSELYTSLQSKVVDGQENPIVNIEIQKYYQVQKYLTLTGHLMGVSTTLVNEKWYQSLPDDIKLALVEGNRNSDVAMDGFGSLQDSLNLEQLKSQGMEVYSPTPEEMAMFREKAVPYVRKWMEKELGEDIVAEYFALVKAAEDGLKAEAFKK